MNYSVGELAAACGCSVRTLHYYGELGLLPPRGTTGAGYRVYDDASRARLMQILAYRELELPLRDIALALDGGPEERRAALRAHRALLLLRRERMDGLLRALDEVLEERPMSKQKITAAELAETRENYAAEARARWGETPEYRQSEQRAAARDEGEQARIAEEAGEIFAAFAAAMDGDPAGEPAQALVRRWQEHITKHYYDCKKEILAGLGEMYVADARFTENIDRFGDGTAAFMRDAIRAYCAK